MNYPKLDNRLSSALQFLRSGKILADVGTDHAYIPIFAVGSGISSAAIASDINDGPVKRAAIHVSSYGLSDKIKVIKTDGLTGLDKYRPDDIVIFGMGGELIVKIIDEAKWVRNSDIRLILSPMTNHQHLRKYLADEGFDIDKEVLSSSDGRIYQTLCCHFDEKVREMTEAELLFGRYNIEHNIENPLFTELLAKTERIFREIVSGKETAGIDTSYENKIIEEIAAINKRKAKI